MTSETQGHPPIWVIALLCLQVLFALALTYVAVNFSGSQLRAVDVLILSVPLFFTVGTSSLSWWSWQTGKRTLSVNAAVISPIVLVLGLGFLLGVGL